MRNIILLILFFSLNANANSFGLSRLSKTQFKNISQEFAANKKHSTATPASMISKEDRKIQAGLIFGTSQSKLIRELSASSSSSNSRNDSIPYYALFAAFYLKENLNGEVSILPPLKSSGVSSGHLTGAIKWSPKDLISIPYGLDIALKGFGGASTTKWDQSISNSSVEVTSNQFSYGIDAQIGKKFAMVEPFFNVGAMQAHNILKNSGSVSIFDSSYSTSNEESILTTGLYYGLGAQVDAKYLKIGFEYGEVYKNTFIRAQASTQF
jgi:hypothetical protein